MSEVNSSVEVSYWMIIAKTQPIIKGSQVPIYWYKKVAEEYAKKFGGTVVRVKCTWQVNNQNKIS